jgi:TDG/mug DNA glycosylase family protein
MLPDLVKPGLGVVIVGTSVATVSAARGHYYSGPTNQFWSLLNTSGLTDGQVLGPEDDARLCEFGTGLSDLVKGRAASSDSMLSAGDFDVAGFISKVEQFRPLVVAFNGKGAAKVLAKAVRQSAPTLGVCRWAIGSSKVYVLPSTSSAACDPRGWAPKTSKAEWWKELCTFVRDARR